MAAFKKELEGWDSNNAVTVVDIADVPKSAKKVPLGELYLIPPVSYGEFATARS